VSEKQPERPGEVSRRAVLAGAVAAAAVAGCRTRLLPDEGTVAAGERERPMGTTRAPVVFVGHGSPMLVVNPTRGAELARLASGLPRPAAILVLSAHWEEAPVTIGATSPVPLIYDFSGFPADLYRARYDAPGAPALADRVEGLLAAFRPRRDARRGLDHGAWVPLRWMYPKADVPVLPVSIPTEDPASLFRLGRALAPLREEGVQILGSGNLVHNLRRLGPETSATPPWAAEFDRWCAEAVSRREVDAILDWRRKAPAPSIAHPTADHFVPLLPVLGAAADGPWSVSYPVEGFEAGTISRRCVVLA
jgi:4,5-DOPA dioxygenase extradiol